MNTLLISLISSLIPVGIDGAKGLIARLVGSDHVKPTTFEQTVQWEQLQVDKLKTLSELDAGGVTYEWVEAVRKLMRPSVVGVVLLTWMFMHVYARYRGVALIDLTTVDATADAVFFYLFGERTLSYSKSRGK